MAKTKEYKMGRYMSDEEVMTRMMHEADLDIVVAKLFSRAVEWVAMNDESGRLELEQISGLITVQLISDLFGVPIEKIAADIIEYRKKN